MPWLDGVGRDDRAVLDGQRRDRGRVGAGAVREHRPVLIAVIGRGEGRRRVRGRGLANDVGETAPAVGGELPLHIRSRVAARRRAERRGRADRAGLRRRRRGDDRRRRRVHRVGRS